MLCLFSGLPQKVNRTRQCSICRTTWRKAHLLSDFQVCFSEPPSKIRVVCLIYSTHKKKIQQDSATLAQVTKFPFVKASRLGIDSMWSSRCCNFQQLSPLVMLASTMDLLSNDTQRPHYPDYKNFIFKQNVYNLSM